MTKENFASINVIIDRSGSMSHLVSDTIGGFNKLLADQKDVEGTASFSLCLFSVDNDLKHYDNIHDVKDLTEETYSPNGGTALLDALGRTINEVGVRLAAMPEEERPSKVFVFVVTDGKENSSKEFTKSQIKEMIKHQEEKYNWSFVFTAANMDAVDEGATFGISAKNAINYSASAGGTHRLYGAMSNSLRRARTAGAAMASNESFFTPEEAKSLIDDNKDIIPGTVDPAPIK